MIYFLTTLEAALLSSTHLLYPTMWLRNFTTRPTQLDKENHPGHSLSNLSSSSSKLAQPRYPASLDSILDSSPGPSPAAFPSKTLQRPPLEAHEERNRSSGEVQQAENDESGGSVGRVSSLVQEDHSRTNIPSEDNAFNLDEDDSAMHTSPLRIGKPSFNNPVRWSMLDEGLQLYIFDSLQSQYKHTKVVAGMLGLSTSELRDLLYLRNHRASHPLSTDQLWEHCVTLSGGQKGYVDPQILNQYMAYFTFAEAFETASIYQKRLTKAFLSQCEINGPWVDALLEDQSGVWNRPEGNSAVLSQLHTDFSGGDAHWESQTSINGDEVWQGTALQGMQIHESHDLDRIAPHIKSPYFPRSLRSELLSRAVSALDPCEYWLVYAQLDSQLGDALPSIDTTSAKVMSTRERRSHPVLYFLMSLLADQANPPALSQKNMEPFQLTPLYMYATARTLLQLRLVREKIEGMPSTAGDRLRMLEAARARCTANLLRDIEGKVPRYVTLTPQPQLGSSSPTSAESTTLVDDGATPTTAGEGSEPESRVTSPVLSQQINAKSHIQGRSPPLEIDFAQRNDKPPHDVLSPCAASPDSKLPEHRPQPAGSIVEVCHTNVTDRWKDRDRSPSVCSFHAARNGDHDVVMTTPPRHSNSLNSKSPVAPSWSPISDVGTASTTLHQATVGFDKQEGIGTKLPRGAPWLSGKVATNFDPTMNDTTRAPVVPEAIKLQSAAPSFLAGIEQYANPAYQNQGLGSPTTTSVSPLGMLGKPGLVPISDMVQTPPSRPPVPPGSTTAYTKKARERTAKPLNTQLQPMKSKPTTKLMTKLLSQESQRLESPKPKSPRSDKGRKRGMYMTAARRAEAAARAEEVAEASREADVGRMQPAPGPEAAP